MRRKSVNSVDMKRNNLSIVYLGSEGNMKSCLGLEELLKDGWKLKLVVGYIPKKQIRGNLTKLKSLINLLLNLALSAISLMSRRRRIQTQYHTMQDLLSSYDFQLILTSDKRLKSVYKILNAQDCDVLLSNGWQFKIMPEVYNLAKVEALNCHSAYLPEYRGGNITYAPLINEERSSGVTVHTIVSRFDAGMILAQERVTISKNETPASLNAKRAQVTGKALIAALSIVGESEKYKPNPIGPFYFRCSYNTYLKYKTINFLRKLFGKKIKRYEPQVRNNI